jgi:23S rRNA (guanosine2251-2'-O)-methyltransferase
MRNIIAGRNPVMEALKAGTVIEKIVFLFGVQGKVINEIKAAAQRRNIQIVEANRQQFRELASDTTTQGVVAIVSTKKYVDVDAILAVTAERHENGFVLILDGIEDPQNLGALVRTAECTGVHGVIIPKHHAAPVTSAATKASAGATEHMAMAEVTNIATSITELKKNGFWVVGLDASGDKLYTDIDYLPPVVLVVGNEGKGIRRLVKEHCDYLVKIPLYGRIASLNASVAGALAMYEVARQRRFAVRPEVPGPET